MQNHFVQNVQAADVTALLRSFARRFFSASEKRDLLNNHTRLVEVLAGLAALADDGARGRDVFEAEAQRLTQDETLSLSDRMTQLEKLRAEQSARPDREAALHALELRYHQAFIDPANRLSQAFVLPLAEQVALAEATEIRVSKQFGIPLDRIAGALVAPMRRAYEATKEARHAPGGAASWLQRAGLFEPDAEPTDDVPAEIPAKEIPARMPRLLTPPRGMGGRA